MGPCLEMPSFVLLFCIIIKFVLTSYKMYSAYSAVACNHVIHTTPEFYGFSQECIQQ